MGSSLASWMVSENIVSILLLKRFVSEIFWSLFLPQGSTIMKQGLNDRKILPSCLFFVLEEPTRCFLLGLIRRYFLNCWYNFYIVYFDLFGTQFYPNKSILCLLMVFPNCQCNSIHFFLLFSFSILQHLAFFSKHVFLLFC